MQQILQFLKDPFALIVPVLLLVGTVLAGLLVRNLLFRFIRGWAARSESHVGLLFIDTLRGPIFLWALILGLHIATQNSRIPARELRHIPQALTLLWILSLTIAMSHFAGSAVKFFGARVTGDSRTVTSLTQKLAQVSIVILGLVWMLRVVFNVNLTPVLATLGVGGLAVALALQDTLSNLFAGFYVSVSGLIRIGDYIKLNSGEEGYVADINWRCTTMRGTTNNLVVIPNSKLGQATFTNYYLPEQRMGMSITISVGYESDIDHVEAILLDETTLACRQVPTLAEDPAPYIRFTPGPGDFSLGFQINFSVVRYADQYAALSELRKRVFKRLVKEGISMPFPTRTVILESKLPHAATDPGA